MPDYPFVMDRNSGGKGSLESYVFSNRSRYSAQPSVKKLVMTKRISVLEHLRKIPRKTS
jgi:hypothetical protein